MSYTIGSLFDGSGGFPLAGAMCGFNTIWASEVEPYPIAVTKSRLPNMRHLGDISKINGANIEPVDIITFGSPCQGLSVAGLQKGLGDERSALFMEAIRIIKEMREATNGKYPKWAIWENVPGAFSSNAGQDFKAVLEELIKIVEPNAVMPDVPKKGWAYADSYWGNEWSIAYRVLDSQYLRTAQRRRRIYLVLDLRGQRARKVLFERESLRGDFTESRAPWQGITAKTEGSIGTDDRKGAICYGIGSYDSNAMKSSNPQSGIYEANTSRTLDLNGGNPACNQGGVAIIETLILDNIGGQAEYGKESRVNGTLRSGNKGAVAYSTKTVALEGNGQRPSHKGNGYIESDKSYTLNATEIHGVAYEQPVAIDRAFFNQGQNALYEPQTYEDGTNPTLVAKGPSAVMYWNGDDVCGTLTTRNAGGCQRMPDTGGFNCVIDTNKYIVRRLTPTECARLQGFPDRWGDIEPKTEFTDEEYRFWLDVRNTHAEINGKKIKDYTKKQMLTWYNKLHSDSAEYKLWGNGIALPCALYVMQGIEETLKEGEK